MRTVLPGKPQAQLQSVSTVQWQGKRLIAYISGNALVILGGPHDLIQTMYHDQCEALVAVTIDERSGKVATCSSDETYIYKPYGREVGVLKWSLQLSFAQRDKHHEIPTLSWGSEEELLVGSSILRLYQTAEQVENVIWDYKLPKPVKIATFSYDAGLIASAGWQDRLVKVWRRQSFNSDDTRFDFTYLPHPTAVTALHWRRPPQHEHHHHEQTVDDVLFSVCIDGKIRIWAATDPHALQGLQLWAEVDMQQSLQPRQLGEGSALDERYAFFISSQDFGAAAKVALEASADNKYDEAHALEHLREVAKTKPDVCVIIDRRGNMSAWGLENVGCKVRKPTDVFNVAHVNDFYLPFLQEAQRWGNNVQFFTFCNEKSPSPFTLLTHHFDGRITWHESSLDQLFDPSSRNTRLQPKALWTGHDESVKKIVRDGNGKALMSWTNDHEGLVWKQGMKENGMLLVRKSSLSTSERIHQACILRGGDFAINLHANKISLWSAQSPVAQEVASCRFKIDGEPSTLMLLLIAKPLSDVQYVATIAHNMSGIVWEIVLPSSSHSRLVGNGDSQHSNIKEFCTFNLENGDEMMSIHPVERNVYPSAATRTTDTSDLNTAFSYSKSGTLFGWSASIDREKTTVKWLATSTVTTNIHDLSLAEGSSTRKVALVDAQKTRLTIWDMQCGQLEYDRTFSAHEPAEYLKWSSTLDQHSLLAIGFAHRLTILVEMRYDYLDTSPAWELFREMSIKDITSHPIGDSAWLGNGNIVLAAGNQMFVYDEDVTISHDMLVNLRISIQPASSSDTSDLVSYLNSSLPLYHPQFLSQSILAGDLVHTRRIILALHKSLKFFVPGDELDSRLSLSIESLLTCPEGSLTSYPEDKDDEEPETITKNLAASLHEIMEKVALPHLTNPEQVRLAGLIESVATAEKQMGSMDTNAVRYHIFLSQHMLRRRQKSTDCTKVAWREIVWAFHSNCQDILIDLISRQFRGRTLWEDARESGMFMWMNDQNTLRAQFEVIARNEYTKTDEKNPIDCSLFYLALQKKNVLLGLWRMASWNREQAGTQRLLKNDFTEARWKTAALKNAYALLGKRRFEYAAAWFLLAGNLQDAVNVCAHQLEDLQLAIAVARVYDGDESPVLRSLLKEKILPQAATEGNRWLATWAFWMLGQRDMAIRALIEPLDTLVNLSHPPNISAKSYLANEPALIVLYKQLREKTQQTLKGTAPITPGVEWRFILQTARQYTRMGCALLALDLVRNWKFLPHPKDNAANGAPAADKRRSSIVEDNVPKSPTKSVEKSKGKPAPTVFKEPEASSLLDSFGF